MAAHSSPTLLANVNGYTLADDQLQRFTGLVFNSGKVIQTGDTAALRNRALADEGLLTVRIYAMIGDTGRDFAELSKDGPLIGYGDDRLTVRSV